MPFIAYAAARSTTEAVFWVSANLVCSPYWLFWQTKTTGSDQTEAMLSDSWKAPMFVAPSPKLQMVTRPSPWSCEARPSPIETGRPPPTMPVQSISPWSGSAMCIGPPRPLEVPVALPSISAQSSRSGTPLAISSPMPR